MSFPLGLTTRYKLTGAASGSTQSNIQLLADLADAPAGFVSSLRSDAGDLRVFQGNGTTQEPFVVKNFDQGAETGQVLVNMSSLPTGGGDIYIAGGNASLTTLSRTDTYGSDNVPHSTALGIYGFNENPGGAAPQTIDLTPAARDLTTAGSMTSDDLVDASPTGKAHDFDGSDDYESRTDSGFNPTDDRTFFAWFKSDRAVTDGFRYLIDFDAAQGGAITFSHTYLAFQQAFAIKVGGVWYKIKITGGNLLSGVWYCMVGVYDSTANVIRVYLDGDQSGGDESVSGSVNHTSNLLRIGSSVSANFDGKIREARLYGSAFSSARIKTIYNNMAGGFWTEGPLETPDIFIPTSWAT